MRTRSPVLRVQVTGADRVRRTYELTAAQERALVSVDRDGKVSESVPFETARGLTRRGLLKQQGPHWYITGLGRLVRTRVNAKRKDQAHGS